MLIDSIFSVSTLGSDEGVVQMSVCDDDYGNDDDEQNLTVL